MSRLSRALIAVALSLGEPFGEDTTSDYIYTLDPACRRRGAKKSSGGSHRRRIKRDVNYRAWKKAFGGVACPDYDGLLDIRRVPN